MASPQLPSYRGVPGGPRGPMLVAQGSGSNHCPGPKAWGAVPSHAGASEPALSPITCQFHRFAICLCGAPAPGTRASLCPKSPRSHPPRTQCPRDPPLANGCVMHPSSDSRRQPPCPQLDAQIRPRLPNSVAITLCQLSFGSDKCASCEPPAFSVIL